jgi:hypothetical protein
VPNGLTGATCSSLGPQYLQPCINTWIINNLQPQGVGGCAGIASAKQQECLNNLVDQAMQERVQQLAQRREYVPHAVLPLPAPAAPAPVPVPVPVRAVGSTPGRRLRQSGEEKF